jgi:hypothetical protein
MRFKIATIKYEDGHIKYEPLVKIGLFGSWKILVYTSRSKQFVSSTKRNDRFLPEDTLEEAERIIHDFRIQEKTKRTASITYREY